MGLSKWILALIVLELASLIYANTRPSWDIPFLLNRIYGLTAMNSDLNFPMDITKPKDGLLYSVPAQTLFNNKRFPVDPLYLQLNFQPNSSLTEFYFLTIRDPDEVLRFSLSMYKRQMYGVQLRYNLLDSNEGEKTIDFPFPQSPSYWRLGVWIKEDSIDFFTNCPRLQSAPFHEEKGIKLLGKSLFRDGASAFLLNSGIQTNPMYFQGVLTEFTMHSGSSALQAPCKAIEYKEESGEPIYTFDPDFGNVIVTLPDDDDDIFATDFTTSTSTATIPTEGFSTAGLNTTIFRPDVPVSDDEEDATTSTVMLKTTTPSFSTMLSFTSVFTGIPDLGNLIPFVDLSDMTVKIFNTKEERFIQNARIENGYLQFENGTFALIQDVQGISPPKSTAPNVAISIDLLGGITNLVYLDSGEVIMSQKSSEGIPTETIRNYSEGALFEILAGNTIIQVDAYNGRWMVQNASTGATILVQEVKDGVLYLANGEKVEMPSTGKENEAIIIDTIRGIIGTLNKETGEVRIKYPPSDSLVIPSVGTTQEVTEEMTSPVTKGPTVGDDATPADDFKINEYFQTTLSVFNESALSSSFVDEENSTDGPSSSVIYDPFAVPPRTEVPPLSSEELLTNTDREQAYSSTEFPDDSNTATFSSHDIDTEDAASKALSASPDSLVGVSDTTDSGLTESYDHATDFFNSQIENYTTLESGAVPTSPDRRDTSLESTTSSTTEPYDHSTYFPASKIESYTILGSEAPIISSDGEAGGLDSTESGVMEPYHPATNYYSSQMENYTTVGSSKIGTDASSISTNHPKDSITESSYSGDSKSTWKTVRTSDYFDAISVSKKSTRAPFETEGDEKEEVGEERPNRSVATEPDKKMTEILTDSNASTTENSDDNQAQDILQPDCGCLEKLLTPELVEKLRQNNFTQPGSEESLYDELFKTPAFLRVVREVIDEFFQRPEVAKRYEPMCNCTTDTKCPCPVPEPAPYNVSSSSKHILGALKDMSNGAIIMKNKSSLAKVAFSLAPGSMVYLSEEDMFYLKVDDKENIWRTIDMNTQSESVRIPEPSTTTTTSPKPTLAHHLIGKSLMLIAHNEPLDGQLRFGAKLSGGHSGAIFGCQRAARRHNISHVFYPLMSTDMFNMDYVVPPMYRYDLPIINLNGDVLFDDFTHMIKGEQIPMAPILTFAGKELESDPSVPCAWIGAKPLYLNGDYEYAARSKCRNWQTRDQIETGLAVHIPMNINATGFLDESNLYNESCAKRCSILCIQISPN